MKDFYVYRYLRSSNTKNGSAGEPYYIGKGRGKRAWSKSHRVKPPSNPALIEIVADNMAEADALQAEMLLIFRHGRIDQSSGCLANCSDGGAYPPSRHRTSISAATREKMRLAKLGRKRGPNPLEWNEKIRTALTGRTLAPEHVEKYAEAMRGRKMPPRSPEHREAIRRAKIGRRRTDMLAGGVWQRKSARSRTGKKRGPYRKKGDHT